MWAEVRLESALLSFQDPSIAASVALLLRFQNLASIIDALVDKIVARLPFLHCPFSTVSHPPVPPSSSCSLYSALRPRAMPCLLVHGPTQLGSVRVSVSAPCASPIKLTLSEHPRAPRTRLSLPAALEVGKHLEYSITPYVRAAARLFSPSSVPSLPVPATVSLTSSVSSSFPVLPTA
ncbi:hypothetical protein K438DRAFT_1980036 [Mycena galopus ATCC 62051]|nr:hypothetical protein K438DRAFT_1980036 [Mycena galopus ATCC 62051]